MSFLKSRVTFAPTLLALLCAAAAQAQAPSGEWQSITAERLRAPAAGDWLGYRRTYDVQAFSPLREINRRTVERLRPVWAYTVRDNSRWVATPIVANGLMYVAEGSGRVLALDAVTGELVWTHVRTYPQDIASSEAYPRHRGVAVYGDVVYFRNGRQLLGRARRAHGHEALGSADRRLQDRRRSRARAVDRRRQGVPRHDGRRLRRARQVRGVRRGERHEALDVLHRAAQRRARLRDVDRERPMAAARRRGLEHGELRRGAKARVFLDGATDAVEHGIARPRRLAVLEHAARGRSRHRQVALALPARARRRVGPLGVRGDARRFASRRPCSARP